MQQREASECLRARGSEPLCALLFGLYYSLFCPKSRRFQQIIWPASVSVRVRVLPLVADSWSIYRVYTFSPVSVFGGLLARSSCGLTSCQKRLLAFSLTRVALLSRLCKALPSVCLHSSPSSSANNKLHFAQTFFFFVFCLPICLHHFVFFYYSSDIVSAQAYGWSQFNQSFYCSLHLSH